MILLLDLTTIRKTRRQPIYYYELDIDNIDEGYPPYVYDKNFDYWLSALSSRVFELSDGTLYTISGDQTYYCLTPKETTFIILIAQPRPNRLYMNFDPGHA